MTIKKFFMIAFPATMLLAACKKTTELLDENNVWVNSDQTKNANVKFIHAFASITPAITTGAGPVMAVYMNTIKITGTTATANTLSYGSLFPATTVYSFLPAGNANFSFIMNRWTSGVFAPVAGDTVFKSTVNLQAGKYYSLFLVDTTQTPTVLVNEDALKVPALDKFSVRFANLAANPTERLDVYSVRQETNVFSNVGYKAITDFIDLPVPVISDTFHVRLTGTTTNLYSLNTFTGTPQRMYTFYSRGKRGLTGATRVPNITFYTNR